MFSVFSTDFHICMGIIRLVLLHIPRTHLNFQSCSITLVLFNESMVLLGVYDVYCECLGLARVPISLLISSAESDDRSDKLASVKKDGNRKQKES